MCICVPNDLAIFAPNFPMPVTQGSCPQTRCRARPQSQNMFFVLLVLVFLTRIKIPNRPASPASPAAPAPIFLGRVFP